MVTKAGEKYAVLYFISNYLEANIDAFNEIQDAIEKQSKSGKK